LGVDAVVEGSVQREHNTVLVSVHLIDGRADRQLWAETYEREIHGLLKLKTELARAIASKIRIELTPVEQVRIHDVKHVPSAAVDAYLKGRFEYWAPAMHWPQLQKAEDFYQQAITIAPAWGRAHAGLAEVNILRIFQKGQQTTPWLTKAQQSVEHALALDDSLTEAHTVAAWGKMMSHWDWLGAEQEFRRAIELNPNYSLAHTWYGHLLNALGRFGEAATEMMRSQELDPRSPLIYMWLAEPAYLMGDYSQALSCAAARIASMPISPSLRFSLNRGSLMRQSPSAGSCLTGSGRFRFTLSYLGPMPYLDAGPKPSRWLRRLPLTLNTTRLPPTRWHASTRPLGKPTRH
jgi:Tfp pilus assembly protein PilF